MARSFRSAKRIPSGTFGTVWIDGEILAECYGAQAKVEVNSETVNLGGQFMEDYKPSSGRGSGSLMLYKADSGMARRMEGIQDGVVPECTVISKLADPDAAGAERVAFYGVKFTDLTLADWEAAKIGRVTAPFTFTRYEFLDMIEVQ